MNTLDQLQQRLNTVVVEYRKGFTYKELAPRITCKNGDSVSVQANRNAYCSPRTDQGPYTQVELGFPSAVPPDYILEHAEEVDNPRHTVYPYTPIELVARWIDECGGIANLPEATPQPTNWEIE